jgi:hypothetical protein
MQNATQKSQKVFVHVQSEIAAHEVEEIGMSFNVELLQFSMVHFYFVCFYLGF